VHREARAHDPRRVGSRNAYSRYGCRCPDAIAANSRYHALRRGANPKPPADTADRLVSSLGTARRLQALVAIGYTNWMLAERLSCRENRVSDLCARVRGRVRTSVARDVTDLFEQLREQPYEGPGSTRARARAARSDWATPDQWEGRDIDDPLASPSEPGDESVIDYEDPYEQWLRERLTTSPGFQVPEGYMGRANPGFHNRMVTRLTELGRGAEEIGYQLGLTQRSVVRVRARAKVAA
jgi:hypothetical protein